MKLDSKSDSGYFNRASAYETMGDYNRAVADFDAEVKLDPKDSGNYFHRGRANLYAGFLSNALADFNQASELNPKGAYTALWLEIVNRRSNLAGRLPQAIAQLNMTKWPAPVIRLFPWPDDARGRAGRRR